MELVERTNQQLSFFQHVPRRVDTYAPYVVYIILNFPFEIFCFQMFTVMYQTIGWRRIIC